MKRKKGQGSIAIAEPALVAAPTTASAAPTPQLSLINPYIDFWLLGGASIAVWIAMNLLSTIRPYSNTLTFRFNNLIPVVGLFALIAQYPHFMASYKLAYTQGGKFILKHWFQLIFVPVVLLALSGWAFFASGQLPADAFPYITLNHLFERLGIGYRVGVMPTFSAELMGWLMNLVLLTTGWHSAKQAYGCMMVYGAWDKYKLTLRQRDIIRYALLAIWINHVTYTRTHQSMASFNDFNYPLFPLPSFTWILSQLSVVLTISAVLYFVIWRKFKLDKQLPSLNFVVPGLALMFWYLPRFSYAEYAPFVAVFHGIQYMGFIHKVERSRMATLPSNLRVWKGTAFLLTFIIIGWLSLELLPDLADHNIRNKAEIDFLFFSVFAFAFSSLHHYFIDNVLWRFHQRDVKEYLLK